jgi:hypothetical protein
MNPSGAVVIKTILMSNRGDKGRQAAAAKPERMAREARAGDLPAGQSHV